MNVETSKDGWLRSIEGPGYRIEVIEGVDDLDYEDNNVDVEVHFDDGRVYSATLFTLTNIQSLIKNSASTGDWGGGCYFWASHMVIVRSLTPDAIAEAIARLIADEQLESAFAFICDANNHSGPTLDD
jgi:hypothetical protein